MAGASARVGGAGQRQEPAAVSPLAAALFRLRGLLPVPILLALVIAGQPTPATLAAGLVVAGVGEAIRLWSAGYIKLYRVQAVQAAELVTAGPYAHVRNPLYWGNTLIGLGYAVMSGWWPALLVAGAVCWLLYAAIVRHEEAYLAARFGEAYAAYCRAVPRFRPRWRPYPGARGQFSWRAALVGEATTVATIAVAFALFTLRRLW